MTSAADRDGDRKIVAGLLLALALASAWLATGVPDTRAETSASKEYQVKAVFLFNFTQFVEWPTNAFREAQTPMVIGILGKDPFGAYLDDTVRGEKVKNRPLIIQRYLRVDDVKNCHVLFISRSEADRLEQILAGLKGRNILTVGDTESFAGRGGMIRFVTEKNKIRLKINLEAAKAADLTISSKLLRPAELVSTGKE